MKPRKGRLHGATMIVWMFFANLFDPAKVAVTEQLASDRQRDPAPERHAAAAPPDGH